ncbi:MAG TPA: BON domain-containing protein [Burkholderiales bacterium]|nr:BON domain-containing protein [Burkholderiales bacterium]
MHTDAVRKQVHAALEREHRINLHRHPVKIESADGIVTLEGEVADVAAKRLALQLAASVQGVSNVVDRLRVTPGERRGDGAVRDSAARLLLDQPELRGCSLNVRSNEKIEVLRRVSDDAAGEIQLSVTDGVVVLEGTVISQSHRRFAGALAWWIPGRRDVVNALEVRPAYEDRDDEISEVMRLVLEADPEVDADQIRTNCNGKVVFLDGAVPSEQQKRRAELDAWSLLSIRGVVNRLDVSS